MTNPDALERQYTLITAAARYDALRREELLADDGATLGRDAALEALALGEVLARKAAYGRQLTVRSARRAGASWAQIGEALGMSKQSAWEGHTRWIDEQAAANARVDHEGMDVADVAEATALAGADSDH